MVVRDRWTQERRKCGLCAVSTDDQSRQLLLLQQGETINARVTCMMQNSLRFNPKRYLTWSLFRTYTWARNNKTRFLYHSKINGIYHTPDNSKHYVDTQRQHKILLVHVHSRRRRERLSNSAIAPRDTAIVLPRLGVHCALALLAVAMQQFSTQCQVNQRQEPTSQCNNLVPVAQTTVP